MKSTEILREEHDLIERALTLLEDASQRLQQGQAVPEGFQGWIVRFIREFADGRHHAKEEDLLFPALEQRGVPRQGGPIGCMLHEHELGRQCVQRMLAALPEAAGDPREFARAATEYAALLRQHIFKENNVLFVMAERCLSEADDWQISHGYKAADQARADAGALVDELAHWERVLADTAGLAIK